jgi:serine protease AprX
MRTAIRPLAVVLVAIGTAGLAQPIVATASEASTASTTVIVRTSAGARHSAASVVRESGGSVTSRLHAISGLVATLPASAVSRLAATPGVASVTPDRRVALSSLTGPDGTDASALGSLSSVARMIGADSYWRAGYTGAGVDVAVIDSGVAPVDGLEAAGKVFDGPDLSYESQDSDLRHLDTYGHGTNMAGIIAGNDTAAGMPGRPAFDPNDRANFYGIAPGARIVSLKVADAFGTTDVSQILVAIDWVITHRNDPIAGLHIRVLNLSFGTDGVQAYQLDPLAFSVEQAWRHGIFVSVSAGNEGYGTAKLNDPAYDPLIMAVGAADPEGTLPVADDTVADFSSGGDEDRHPDVVAPGTQIVSLRVPNSYLDQQYPGARRGTTPRLFRGSGTSQAAAVVSGAAALIIQQRPSITPDQLKKLLKTTAAPLGGPRPTASGSGEINLAAALGRSTPSALLSAQPFLPSTGLGSLEAARGTLHIIDAGVALTGERDIFGNKINLVDWVLQAAKGVAFDALGDWMGTPWTGATFTGHRWNGRSWTSSSWAGRSWTSAAWDGRSWTGWSWTGAAWSGRSWTSGTWSGNVWSSSTWN